MSCEKGIYIKDTTGTNSAQIDCPTSISIGSYTIPVPALSLEGSSTNSEYLLYLSSCKYGINLQSSSSSSTDAIVSFKNNADIGFTLKGNGDAEIGGQGVFIGNVGIGTTTPTHALEVNGVAKFLNDVGMESKLSVDGNVGIGTSNPQNKLDVVGGITAQSCFIQSPSENETSIIMKSMPSTNKQFELRIRDDTTSSYPLHIGPYTYPTDNFMGICIKQSNGYVGINNVADPTAPLDVNGDTKIYGRLYLPSGQSQSLLIGTEQGRTETLMNVAGGATIGYKQGQQSGLWISNPSPNNGNNSIYNVHPFIQGVNDGFGASPILLNPDSGNVGIGTTNPQSKLDVGGAIVARVTSGVGLTVDGGLGQFKNNIMLFGATPQTVNSILMNSVGGARISCTEQDADIEFTLGNVKHKMLTNGYVGINNTNPSKALDVYGDVRCDVLTSAGLHITSGYVGIGTADPDYPLHITSTFTLYNNYSFINPPITYFYATQPVNLLIKPTNQTPLTGGTSIYAVGAVVSEVAFAAVSDKRIKTNIIDVPDNLALEQVRNIDVRYYEYKDKVKKGTETTIGFIAQQVKEIVPSAVSIQKNIIPNEMRIIESPSWTTITDSSGINTYKLTISDLSDNSGNTLYRFYVSNDQSGNDECQKEIKSLDTEPKSFIFKEKWTNVFLYGKEVDDFHILDKQKLFAVNFSATQEIDRIQQAEKTKLEAAESKIVTLENEVSTLKTQLAQVLARLNALENSN